MGLLRTPVIVYCPTLATSLGSFTGILTVYMVSPWGSSKLTGIAPPQDDERWRGTGYKKHRNFLQ